MEKKHNLPAYILRSDLIQAFRNSDHIHCKMVSQHRTRVTCYRFKNREKPSIDSMAEYAFEVPSAVEIRQGKGAAQIKSTPPEGTEAEVLLTWTSFDWELQSVFGMFELKDQVELIWIPDVETNAEITAAGVHVDALKLVLYRHEFRLHFRLTTRVGTPDSRMIHLAK